jgi:hypothetical protein
MTLGAVDVVAGVTAFTTALLAGVGLWLLLTTRIEMVLFAKCLAWYPGWVMPPTFCDVERCM